MHLFLIVMSKCTFQIWKLCCKRLLDMSPENLERQISPQEARNLALSTVNSHLEQDRILTSEKRYGKSALPEDLVLKMWSGTLQNKHSLPKNWLQASGVLVGIPLWTEDNSSTPQTAAVG